MKEEDGTPADACSDSVRRLRRDLDELGAVGSRRALDAEGSSCLIYKVGSSSERDRSWWWWWKRMETKSGIGTGDGADGGGVYSDLLDDAAF